MELSVIEGTIQSWRAFDHPETSKTFYSVRSDALRQFHEGPSRQDYFDVVAAMPGAMPPSDQEYEVAGAERRAN